MVDFKFPDVGEGIAEGEIVKWLVAEGDTVKADQNIVQVETDKAVVDLPAPTGGKITKINFKEGQTIKVGEVLCSIGGEESVSKEKSIESKTPEPEEKKEEPKDEIKLSGKSIAVSDDKIKKKPKKIDLDEEKKEKSEEKEPEEEKSEETKPHSEPMKGEAQTKKVLAAPVVRKLANDLKIDLSSVSGTGPGGRVERKDIEKIKPGESEKKAEIPQQKIQVKKKYDQFGYLERMPLKGIRKTIAANMIKSQTEAAQVTAMEDIDVTKLWEFRKKEKDHFAVEGVKLTFLPFIIKASISALKENPILNSSISEDGSEILIKKYFNIGVAVETDVGLMVPVIKIAEKKSIAKLAKEIQDLAEKAKTRKIDIMDLKGSTFTVTNYGSVGGNYGTPIINPGEASILGLGRIFDRVVLDEKTKKVRNVKILPVSLTFDHRILDGAQAARFLESLKMFLEDPSHLFSENKVVKNKKK